MEELVARLKEFFEAHPYGTFHIEGELSEEEIKDIKKKIEENRFPCNIHCTLKISLRHVVGVGCPNTYSFSEIYKVKITKDNDTRTLREKVADRINKL